MEEDVKKIGESPAFMQFRGRTGFELMIKTAVSLAPRGRATRASAQPVQAEEGLPEQDVPERGLTYR